MSKTIAFSELTGRFSTSTGNAFTQALKKRQESGKSIVDLVNPNWYDNGFAFPDALLEEAYRRGLQETSSYKPDSHGNPKLRQAISDWYGRRGEIVDPESIFITPGSSFAYLALFRLLGENGIALCPRPSYPLFEDIAAVAGWGVADYPLDAESGWHLSADKIANRVSNDTRAICLVSPHNPPGTIYTETELSAVGAVSQRLGIPVLFDEVFCEFRYPTGDAKLANFPRPRETDYPLVFLLNGFSKLLALPGHKIGWVIVRGSDKDAVKKSLNALDYLFDTFLPVSEVAQSAAEYLLMKDGGKAVDSVSKELCEKLAKCRDCVTKVSQNFGMAVHTPEGGVYSIVDLPNTVSAEQFAIELIEKAGIVVHPGYFYDLPHEAIVFTFLVREEVLTVTLPQLFEFLTHYNR